MSSPRVRKNIGSWSRCGNHGTGNVLRRNCIYPPTFEGTEGYTLQNNLYVDPPTSTPRTRTSGCRRAVPVRRSWIIPTFRGRARYLSRASVRSLPRSDSGSGSRRVNCRAESRPAVARAQAL